MAKHGKKYREASKLVESLKQYPLQEAIELVKKVSTAKFGGSVEIAVKTFANPKYNDQMIRATTVLPHGTGKVIRIAVYISDDKQDEAIKAGADVVGSTDLIKNIEAGQIDFDVLVTTAEYIKDLARVAKVLWPKGLMPSPKAGTVAINLKDTINEIKKGRIEFRLDKTWNIHSSVGKLTFSDEQLSDNITSLLKGIEDNKPTGIKGKLIKKVVIAPTMGPGVQVTY